MNYARIDGRKLGKAEDGSQVKKMIEQERIEELAQLLAKQEGYDWDAPEIKGKGGMMDMSKVELTPKGGDIEARLLSNTKEHLRCCIDDKDIEYHSGKIVAKLLPLLEEVKREERERIIKILEANKVLLQPREGHTTIMILGEISQSLQGKEVK